VAFNILCFGDSNTYGTNPVDKSRYDLHKRWPGILRDQLGEKFWIIEEGQPGRTTVWNDPIEGIKSGREYLIPCLESHSPLDLVILLLGTNDLKERFSLTATDIALGARTLIQIIQSSSSAPQVMLIAPPPVLDIPNLWEPMRGAPETSKRLAAAYQKVASENNCHFLDAGSIIGSSVVDGFHWDIPEHGTFGREVASQIYKIFDTK